MKKIVLAAIVFAASQIGFSSQAADIAVATNDDKTTSVTDAEKDEALRLLLEENKKLKQNEEQRAIWGKGRFSKLGYASGQTALIGEPVEKCSYGFFLQKGTHFKLATVARMVKFNLDAVWFDVQFNKYKDPYKDLPGGWTSEINGNDNGDSDDPMDAITDFTSKIGRMSLSIGLGVGPSVQVAPFINMAKGLRPLTATLYFHYLPSATIYMHSDDDDMEASTAFTNQFEFGGNIRYRWVALGLEGHFGQGKFRGFESLIGGDAAPKEKRKFATTRFYVQFTF